MSAELLKELRKTSTAGLPQDYWQMNRDQTQDRLGANGLVNKGQYQYGKKPDPSKTQPIHAFRSTVSTMMHSTPWMHNEIGKKHSFYKRTPAEEAEMAKTMGSLQWASAGAGRTMMSPQPKQKLI